MTQRALVTGGADGIGWAICKRLAAAGLRCAIADIDEAKAISRAEELGEGHLALAVDLRDVEQAHALPARAQAALGGLDIIINNAGIIDNAGVTIPEADGAKFDALVAVNLESVTAICRTGAEVIGPGGRIVNLASGAAFRPLPLRGPYSATKAAVVALTRALARAWPEGPFIAAVAPGYIRTPLVEDLIALGRMDPVAVERGIPAGRLGRPDDIAAAVAFLATADSAVLAGHVLSVDGGVLAAAGAGYDHQEDAEPGTEAALVIGQGELAQELEQALAGATRQGLGDDLTFPARGPVVVIPDATTTLADLLQLERRRAAAGASGPMLFLCTEARDVSPEISARNRAFGMFARTRALEVAPRRERINAAILPEGARAADLVRFLVSPDADYIQAQAFDLTEA